MHLSEYLHMAWESLRSNLGRSLLTMLGMIIGVTAVITVISIGNGAQQSVASQIEGLGVNLIVVTAGRSQSGGVAGSAGSGTTLSYADEQAIAALGPPVKAVAPEADKGFQITAGAHNINSQVDGTAPVFPEVRRWGLASGRFFTAAEVSSAAEVADIGSTAAGDLFGSANPVGQAIQINGIPFTVIGVMQEQNSAGPGNTNGTVYIPITSALYRLIGGASLQNIDVEASSATQMTAATNAIESLLEERHHITSSANDDFVIRSQDQLLQARTGVAGTFTVLLSGIAGISLLVGGIGIMNIMLVSVTERTREIGIRKAIGASSRAILTQFVIEAVLLSLTGGLIGVLVGIGASRLVSRVAGWPVLVPLGAILLAAGFSLGVGLFFGIYPAHRAAQLDPIQALRSE